MKRVVSGIAMVAVVGCTQVPINTTPTATRQTQSVKVPELTAAVKGQDSQEKDGIRVTVTPEPFRLERTYESTFRAVRRTIELGQYRPVQRRDVVTPDLQPESLIFKVRIANGLGRVIRLAGSVVSFQMAGKNVSVPQEDYAEFLSGIVLPRQETELTLRGPYLGSFAGPDLNGLAGDTATVALLLYDVVTATDNAGNPTKRANFEYYYRLRLVPRPDSVVATITSLSVPVAWWNHIATQQQGDVSRWVRVPQLECLPNCGNEQ